MLRGRDRGEGECVPGETAHHGPLYFVNFVSGCETNAIKLDSASARVNVPVRPPRLYVHPGHARLTTMRSRARAKYWKTESPTESGSCAVTFPSFVTESSNRNAAGE